MASVSDDVRRAIAALGETITEQAWTLGRDPRREARMRRRWGTLQGLLALAFTLAARRATLRAWNVLTGEAPPVAGQEAREAMWARVASYEIPIGEIDAGVRGFQNAMTSLRQMDGAAAAYLLVDRTSGKALTLTLWESDDALRASEEAAERIRREAVGEAVRNVERYEIALHESFA
jgi:heme-degrading monooxygenase HmoA